MIAHCLQKNMHTIVNVWRSVLSSFAFENTTVYPTKGLASKLHI